MPYLMFTYYYKKFNLSARLHSTWLLFFWRLWWNFRTTIGCPDTHSVEYRTLSYLLIVFKYINHVKCISKCLHLSSPDKGLTRFLCSASRTKIDTFCIFPLSIWIISVVKRDYNLTQIVFSKKPTSIRNIYLVWGVSRWNISYFEDSGQFRLSSWCDICFIVNFLFCNLSQLDNKTTCIRTGIKVPQQHQAIFARRTIYITQYDINIQ